MDLNIVLVVIFYFLRFFIINCKKNLFNKKSKAFRKNNFLLKLI